MTAARRLVRGLGMGVAILATGTPAMARLCARGVYCPTFKVTLRSFASHLAGCEPCGNIVAIHPDGSMDWSANGSWSGPAQ